MFVMKLWFLRKFNLDKLLPSELLYRFAKGTYWAFFSTVITRIFHLITSVLIARLLGKNDYGVYGLIQSTINIGLMFGFAMGGTLSKYVAEFKHKDKLKTSRIIALFNRVVVFISILTIVVFISFSSSIANNIYNKSGMDNLLITAGILVFVSIINSVQIGTIAGFENFKGITQINTCLAVGTIIFSVPFVYFWGVQGAIFASILTTIVSCFLSFYILKVELKKHNINVNTRQHKYMDELYIIWEFTIPNMISALFIVSATWISNTILVNENNGYAELGLFNAANQWRQLIAFLPQILATVTLPILSETYGRENKEDFYRAFRMNLRLTWSYALPMTIFVILFRNPISYLFGSQFSGMTSMMILLMITAFVNILSSVISTAMLSMGNIWPMSLFNLFWGMILVLSTYSLAQFHGGFGLSIAYLLATSLMTVGQIIYIEFTMKQGVFSGERLLILSTIITLFVVSAIGYYNNSSIIVGLAVLIVSIVPFFRSMFKYANTI